MDNSWDWVPYLLLVAVLIATFTVGKDYINHIEAHSVRTNARLERENVRYIKLCRELDCVNPRLKPAQ